MLRNLLLYHRIHIILKVFNLCQSIMYVAYLKGHIGFLCEINREEEPTIKCCLVKNPFFNQVISNELKKFQL